MDRPYGGLDGFAISRTRRRRLFHVQWIELLLRCFAVSSKFLHPLEKQFMVWRKGNAAAAQIEASLLRTRLHIQQDLRDVHVVESTRHVFEPHALDELGQSCRR